MATVPLSKIFRHAAKYNLVPPTEYSYAGEQQDHITDYSCCAISWACVDLGVTAIYDSDNNPARLFYSTLGIPYHSAQEGLSSEEAYTMRVMFLEFAALLAEEEEEEVTSAS